MVEAASKKPESESRKRSRKAIATLARVLRRAGNRVRLEWRFHPERGWRFDVALFRGGLRYKPHGALGRWRWQGDARPWIAVEVEGLNGRHQRTGGFRKDMEKYNEAAVLGWTVVRLTVRDLEKGEALVLLNRLGVRVKARAARGKGR